MGVERSTDKRGRITIPAELRERFGDRYRVVALDDGIKLVPIPRNPIETLRESGSDELREASAAALHDAARSRGDAEADEHVR
jgi:bifunctional DNA-binding transcriptional regulator/antitoxin component of YhaV-PrlF toxin-antitoxin module